MTYNFFPRTGLGLVNVTDEIISISMLHCLPNAGYLIITKLSPRAHLDPSQPPTGNTGTTHQVDEIN